MAEININVNSVSQVKSEITNYKNNFSGIEGQMNLLTSDIPEEAQKFDIPGSVNQFKNIINIIDDLSNKINSLFEALNGDTISQEKMELLRKIGISTVDYEKIVKEGFTVQGYTIIDGKVFISAYYKDHKKVSKLDYDNRPDLYNSRVYVFEEGELKSTIVLDNHSHVGGITYDPDNEIMFITGNKGKVNSYNYKFLQEYIDKANIDRVDLTKDDYRAAVIKNNININDKLDGFIGSTQYAATLTYKDGSLYVATFTGSGDLLEYKYEYDGKEINAKTVGKPLKLHGAVQGINIYNKDGRDYIIEAQSAWANDSRIQIYDKETGALVGAKKISHQGLEGVDVDANGNISGVFEYGSSNTEKYNFDDIVNEYQEDMKNLSVQDFNNKYEDGILEAKGAAFRAKEIIEEKTSGITYDPDRGAHANPMY